MAAPGIKLPTSWLRLQGVSSKTHLNSGLNELSDYQYPSDSMVSLLWPTSCINCCMCHLAVVSKSRLAMLMKQVQSLESHKVWVQYLHSWCIVVPACTCM